MNDNPDWATTVVPANMTRWRLADGRIVQTGPRHYVASCNACGWAGSSGACGTDYGPGDDSDVYCPACGRAGADCGSLADTAKEMAHSR